MLTTMDEAMIPNSKALETGALANPEDSIMMMIADQANLPAICRWKLSR